MNTLNWRAIGVGVSVGIGGSLLLNVLFHLFPFDGEKHPIWAILAISYAAGALIDIAVGATTGWLARRRGASHGFVAGLITSLISPLLGYLMVLMRERGEVPFALIPYLYALLPGTVVGMVLATIAGAIAAHFAVKQVPG